MAVGIIKSVEQCAITVNNTQSTVDYTLTKGQDVSNCVPFATWKASTASNSTPDNWLFDVEMLSSPARVRVQRDGTNETYYVVVYVVEFEPTKVKVQQGTWQIGNGASSDTETLGDSVTMNRTCLQTYYRFSSNNQTPRDMMVASKLNSTTQVRMERWGTPAYICNGHYYVFEALNNEWTVTHYDTGDTAANPVDTAIPAVVVARTFLIGSTKTVETTNAIEQNSHFFRLENSTNVEIRRWSGGDTSRHYFQVIECADDSIFVQHRYAYGDDSTVYDEWTLPQAVDTDTSIAHNPNTQPYCRTDGSGWYLGIYRHYIASAGTKLRMERYLPSPPDDDCYFVGQVIEFTGTEFFCEGTVRVDGTLTSGIEVNLYRREDDLLVGTDTTTAAGTFTIPSRFHGERHYLIAKATVSGMNSAIVDWLLSPSS
jgi:hypothetical protein